MQVVNIFYELARTAKGVRGFRYGKRYNKGNGLDPYPLVWVDDPVLIQTASDSTQSYTVNVDILDCKTDASTVLGIQTWAELLALAFRERFLEELGGYSFERLSMVSLSEYVGDNAAGMRCTFILVGAYPIDRCEEFFDPDKQLTIESPLPEFETKMADGCAVFSDADKLPRFRLT